MLSQHFGEAFQYGLTEGVPGLREEIQRISEGRGIACKADDVVITSGSQQSLDVLARALINPGDTVVVERPTSPRCRSLAAQANLNPSVPTATA